MLLHLLNILEFLGNPRNKIKELIKEKSGKSIFIFPIFFGIFVWSDMLKSAKIGDKLESLQIFTSIVFVGSIIGVISYFVLPYVITQVSQLFTKESSYEINKKLFSWCLFPFIINALLVLLEFFIWGKNVYSSTFSTNTAVSLGGALMKYSGTVTLYNPTTSLTSSSTCNTGSND